MPGKYTSSNTSNKNAHDQDKTLLEAMIIQAETFCCPANNSTFANSFASGWPFFLAVILGARYSAVTEYNYIDQALKDNLELSDTALINIGTFDLTSLIVVFMSYIITNYGIYSFFKSAISFVDPDLTAIENAKQYLKSGANDRLETTKHLEKLKEINQHGTTYRAFFLFILPIAISIYYANLAYNTSTNNANEIEKYKDRFLKALQFIPPSLAAIINFLSHSFLLLANKKH